MDDNEDEEFEEELEEEEEEEEEGKETKEEENEEPQAVEKKKGPAPTVLELFTGGGGMALGLERAGLKVNMLVEKDRHCVSTLRRNRPDWLVVSRDVSECDWTGMQFDVVAGGFPCQAFTTMGKRRGFDDPRGKMFFEFVRCIEETKPKIFLGENVEGLVNHDGGKTLEEMLGLLKGLGYNVEYRVLDSVQFSVPQARKRLILVEGGNANDLAPELQAKLFPDGKVPEGKKRLPTGLAKRLRWDQPAPTLLTKPQQRLAERIHPSEARPLTIREYARIQTFPDDWEFEGGLVSQYSQIGNAMPVKLAEALGQNILETLTRSQNMSRYEQYLASKPSLPQTQKQKKKRQKLH